MLKEGCGIGANLGDEVVVVMEERSVGVMEGARGEERIRVFQQN